MDECLEAGLTVSEDIIIYNPTSLFANEYKDTPCGCYLWPHINNTMVISYDSGNDGCKVDDEVGGRPICKVSSSVT